MGYRGMRFREIRTSEKISERDENTQKAYMNIRPVKVLDIKTLNDLVQEEFNKAREAN